MATGKPARRDEAAIPIKRRLLEALLIRSGQQEHRREEATEA